MHMDIQRDGRYVLYQVNDGNDGSTHLVVDLAATLPSISDMANAFGGLAVVTPPAFVFRGVELRARLEEEACLLLDDFVLDSLLDCWDEDHPGEPYDVLDHLTGTFFRADAEVSLLKGADLLRIMHGEVEPWEGPYTCELVLRPDEGNGTDLYVAPFVRAQQPHRASCDFYASGGRRPWSQLVRQLVTFAGT